MAIADNRYSRFVQLAKVAFPLFALGLLSTLFLFSRSFDPTLGIPFADFDVEEVAREQRLASPKFSGVTSDGSEVTMSASAAIPDPTNSRRFMAEDVIAKIDTVAGLVYDVTANAGDYDGANDMLILNGDVVVITSSGYRLETEQLRTNVEHTSLEIPVSLKGFGPDGNIEANSLVLQTDSGSQVLVFKGDVKLIYDPTRE